MSLGAQKEQKAEAKRKRDIQMKISKADKNFKLVMGELKKFTEKHDDTLIHPKM